MGTRSHQLHRVLLRTNLILAWVWLIRFAGTADAQPVTLAWDPTSAPGIAGYNIYRSESFGFFTSVPLNGASLVTTTSFTDSSVQNSRTYYYAVTAVTTSGLESGVSAQVQVEVGPDKVTTGYVQIPLGLDGVPKSSLAIVGYSRDATVVSETAFPASPLIQRGRIYAEVENPVNTGIAIANLNNDAVNLNFYFTGADGSKLYSGSTSIAADSQVVAFLNEPPFRPPVDVDLSSVRTFTFSASLPMAFAATRAFINERSEVLITSLPIAATDSPALSPVPVPFNPVLSSVAVPYYIDGGAWKGRIVLVNPTDRAISGVVEFFVQQGSAGDTGSLASLSGVPDESSHYIIPPSSAGIVERVPTESAFRVGWVRVTSASGTPTPSVVSLFSLQANGVRISDGGMTAVREGSIFRAYAEASGKIGEAGSVRTSLAISNSAPTPVTIRLELLALDGKPTGMDRHATIPPVGQVTLFLDQLGGLQSFHAPFSGFVRISGAPVAVVGLKTRYNERGDFLLTPIPAFLESESASPSELVFFTRGAGFSTDFIIFNSSGKVLLPWGAVESPQKTNESLLP